MFLCIVHVKSKHARDPMLSNVLFKCVCVFRRRIRVFRIVSREVFVRASWQQQLLQLHFPPSLSPPSLLSPPFPPSLPSLSPLPSVAVEVHSLRGRLRESTDDHEGGVSPAVSHGSQLPLGSPLTRPMSPDLSQQVRLSPHLETNLPTSLSYLPKLQYLIFVGFTNIMFHFGENLVHVLPNNKVYIPSCLGSSLPPSPPLFLCVLVMSWCCCTSCS